MSVSAFQIGNGLAAGNIGDEFMNRAFWRSLPQGIVLEVELLPNASLQRSSYPQPHRYRAIDWAGDPACSPSVPGILVGDTPVTDALGVEWPLRFLERRLTAFHEAGLAVDALGIGAEPLLTDEGRSIFDRAFRPIRSWTVRSERSRDVLVGLGVAETAITVGADWAWRYAAESDRLPWASSLWHSLGVDKARPVVVVNCVNEVWAGEQGAKRALAEALDFLVAERGAQVAFFCNEMREGPFFDREAAAEVARAMTRPSLLLPCLYYAPDEVLALLSRARLVVSGRYHMTLEAVLAGTVPVSFARSPKMTELLEDLGAPCLGPIEAATGSGVERILSDAWTARDTWVVRLQAARGRLAERAARNAEGWLRTSTAEPSRYTPAR